MRRRRKWQILISPAPLSEIQRIRGWPDTLTLKVGKDSDALVRALGAVVEGLTFYDLANAAVAEMRVKVTFEELGRRKRAQLAKLEAVAGPHAPPVRPAACSRSSPRKTRARRPWRTASSRSCARDRVGGSSAAAHEDASHSGGCPRVHDVRVLRPRVPGLPGSRLGGRLPARSHLRPPAVRDEGPSRPVAPPPRQTGRGVRPQRVGVHRVRGLRGGL